MRFAVSPFKAFYCFLCFAQRLLSFLCDIFNQNAAQSQPHSREALRAAMQIPNFAGVCSSLLGGLWHGLDLDDHFYTFIISCKFCQVNQQILQNFSLLFVYSYSLTILSQRAS